MVFNMVRTFLLLGSNEGDRMHFLSEARKRIELTVGKIKKASSVYETAAWGNTQQAAFLNQVIELETKLAPTTLLHELLAIEAGLGRARKEKWGKRTIDIDILYYEDSIIQEPELTIPHPEIARRRFTLVPLAELAPDLIDPVSQKSVQQMLIECGDELEVKVFENSSMQSGNI